MEYTHNGYTYEIVSVKDGAGYVAIIDNWYRTEVQSTVEMAHHAARIYLSSYGG